MRACSLCKELKEVSQFRLRFRYNKYTPRSQCKACESKQQVIRSKGRMERDPEFKRSSLERVETWGLENKPQRLCAENARRKAKYSADLEYRSARTSQSAKYRAQKLSATPKWLTKAQWEEMYRVYKVANKVSLTTGKPHEVDHIIPLQGENVCGLHVPWNLAILPASINRSKGNAHPYIGPTT